MWVYKRFAKSVPKNVPAKEEKQKAIEQLIEKLKSDQPDEIFFVDEANFMTGSYVQRGWCKRQDKKSLQPDKEGIQNNIWSIAFKSWQNVLDFLRN